MFTQEKADAICARLAEGESLRSVCRDIGISHCQVMDWARENEPFRNQYTRARELGDDADFEGLVDLADEQPSRTATGAVDPGWVAWQKTRIDTRKWSLAKKRPKKYGDKIEHEHKGGVNLTITPTENLL